LIFFDSHCRSKRYRLYDCTPASPSASQTCHVRNINNILAAEEGDGGEDELTDG